MLRAWKFFTMPSRLLRTLGTSYTLWTISLVFPLLVGSAGGGGDLTTSNGVNVSFIGSWTNIECSGRGYFDKARGYCVCDDGFAPKTPRDCLTSLKCGKHGVQLENGTCSCDRLWTGERCNFTACENGGTISNSSKCICPAGFKGDNCQECVNESEEAPHCSDPNSGVVAHLRRHKIAYIIGTVSLLLLAFLTVGGCCYYWRYHKKRSSESGSVEEVHVGKNIGNRRNTNEGETNHAEQQKLIEDNAALRSNDRSGAEPGARDEATLQARCFIFEHQTNTILDNAPPMSLRDGDDSGVFTKSKQSQLNL